MLATIVFLGGDMVTLRRLKIPHTPFEKGGLRGILPSLKGG